MNIRRCVNVFISSEMRELEYDREVVSNALYEINVNAVLFEIFPSLNQSAPDAYLGKIDECEIFILILWKSLSNPVVEEYKEAIKKNKPILIFIKSLIENEERDERMKKFISGLTNGKQRNLVYKNYRKIEELKQAVKDSIINEISKFYIEPTVTLSRQEMYELGTQIIKFSQNRLYIFQKTPSLLLGARNYLSNEDQKFSYENEFLNTLENWIDCNIRFSNKELIYMFSLDETKLEIEKYNLKDNIKYLKTLEERIKKYQKIELDTGFRFKFCPLVSPISGPMIIGDIWYAMWFLGHDDAIAFSQRNEKISNTLVRMLKVKCHSNLNENSIL